MTNNPQCFACIHLDRDASFNPMRYDAFPDGIPVPIQANKHDHSKPYPGDHGIRYDQIRPGPRAEVSVWAILTDWRRPDRQTAETTEATEPRKSKGRRRAAR
jgi:hypothetical protein